MTIDFLLRYRCPADSEWAKLVANLIEGPEADRLLSHAVNCRFCSTALKQTVFLLSENAPESSSPEVVNQFEAMIPDLALRMAGRSRKRAGFHGMMAKLGTLVRGPRLIALTAPVPVALALLAVFWPGPPFSKLADVYSAQRTIELRVPGAAYAPIRVEKSSGRPEPSAELLDNEMTIQRHLERKPEDAGWLHALGRAQLLAWQYDSAIETFQRAAATADSPEFWIDRATAYFQRAEAKRSAADYSEALRQLDTALQKRPRDAVALFNRALVYERLSRFGEAIQDLESCIQVERDKGWKEEARRRLEQLRRRNGTARNLAPQRQSRYFAQIVLY